MSSDAPASSIAHALWLSASASSELKANTKEAHAERSCRCRGCERINRNSFMTAWGDTSSSSKAPWDSNSRGSGSGSSGSSQVGRKRHREPGMKTADTLLLSPRIMYAEPGSEFIPHVETMDGVFESLRLRTKEAIGTTLHPDLLEIIFDYQGRCRTYTAALFTRWGTTPGFVNDFWCIPTKAKTQIANLPDYTDVAKEAADEPKEAETTFKYDLHGSGVITYLDSFPAGKKFNTRRYSDKRVRSLIVQQTTMAVLDGKTVAVQVVNARDAGTKEWYSERSFLNYGGTNTREYDQSEECYTHAGVLSVSYDLWSHSGLMGTMYDERTGVLFCIKGRVSANVVDEPWMRFDEPHYHYVSIIGTSSGRFHSHVLARHAHWYCWCRKFTSSHPEKRLKCELVEQLATSKRFLNSMTKWHAFAAAWDSEHNSQEKKDAGPARDRENIRAIPDAAFGIGEFKRLTKVIPRMPA